MHVLRGIRKDTGMGGHSSLRIIHKGRVVCIDEITGCKHKKKSIHDNCDVWELSVDSPFIVHAEFTRTNKAHVETVKIFTEIGCDAVKEISGFEEGERLLRYYHNLMINKNNTGNIRISDFLKYSKGTYTLKNNIIEKCPLLGYKLNSILISEIDLLKQIILMLDS